MSKFPICHVAACAIASTLSFPVLAEATWADLFPLLGKVIVLGLPIEIAQFCIGLWPWTLGLTLLSWAIWWWRSRAGRSEIQDKEISSVFDFVLRPRLITGLTALMILIALLAPFFIKKELLANNRFNLNPSKFQTSTHQNPPPKPFVSPDGKPWPKFAVELDGGHAEHSGQTTTLVILNKNGEAGAYIKLCRGEEMPCQEVRRMFIPNLSAIRLKGVAAGSYYLHYRPVDNIDEAGESKVFSVADMTEEETQIKLPAYLVWNNYHDLFHRIPVDKF